MGEMLEVLFLPPMFIDEETEAQAGNSDTRVYVSGFLVHFS